MDRYGNPLLCESWKSCIHSPLSSLVGFHPRFPSMLLDLYPPCEFPLKSPVSSNTPRRPQQDCNASAAEVGHQRDVSHVLCQGVKCRRLGCNFAKRDGVMGTEKGQRKDGRTFPILRKLHLICGKIRVRQKRSNGTSSAKDSGRGQLKACDYLDVAVLGLAGFTAHGPAFRPGFKHLAERAGDGQPRHAYPICEDNVTLHSQK